ncbi:type 3 dihydrofolate reductase [Candidatus Woesearchaeota archaeon]|jgi:dihydrofolate reductase|nr:type 3 dihydrofolate reductase [Candidatus Woesearchaeota archaeon]|tara:strand:- start:5297 stop:5794 length:498 start_codon:yes stop_codon:yes gene_type:complete
MILSIIAAIGKNKVIGKDNDLPWGRGLPADMKHFKELTAGKPVLMGRKTFESIGKPLPNRINIIITRDENYKAEGCIVVHSIDEAVKAAGNAEEVMVIGGSQIYKEFLPRANKMYLTIVDADFEGDTYFPEYKVEDWKETAYEEHERDAENPYNYTFLVLTRKKQ